MILVYSFIYSISLFTYRYPSMHGIYKESKCISFCTPLTSLRWDGDSLHFIPFTGNLTDSSFSLGRASLGLKNSMRRRHPSADFLFSLVDLITMMIMWVCLSFFFFPGASVVFGKKWAASSEKGPLSPPCFCWNSH